MEKNATFYEYNEQQGELYIARWMEEWHNPKINHLELILPLSLKI